MFSNAVWNGFFLLINLSSLFTLNIWCNALYLLHKLINSHESRFNLFGLLTNNTQRICLVAKGGRELVTFRSQSPTLSLFTTHVDKDNAYIAETSCSTTILTHNVTFLFDHFMLNDERGYILRLTLPGEVVEDDRASAKYDADEGKFTNSSEHKQL